MPATPYAGRIVPGSIPAHLPAVAALCAAAADALMLFVAQGDVATAAAWPKYALVWLGGLLGVCAIPFYYFGYAGALRLAGHPAHAASPAMVGAALVALFGTLTHGATAYDISTAVAAGGASRPPEVAFASPLLLACAFLSAAGALLACAHFLWLGLRHANGWIRTAAILNPVTCTLLLAVPGALSEPVGAYLTPAAPNLAHLAFFALVAKAQAADAASREDA